MADDILKYKDFIEEDGSLDKLIAKIEQVGDTYTKATAKVREDAKALAEAIAKIDAAQEGSNDTLTEAEKQLAELEAAQTKYNKSLADNAIELAKLKEQKRQQDALNKSIAKEEIAQQKLTKDNQLLIQKSIKLVNDEKTSYELLSAQYTKMKIAVNALSVEYREQTAEGQALVKNTNQVYQQMIKLQSVTGKNTLQVGDYSKATYGLNANINNLTRELPNLGVSASTFFLSISNNLPMLKDSIDQIKRVNKTMEAEGMKTTSVWKQLGKSILSWNTVISVAVALLTVFGGKIVKWIQTRREANKELKKGVDAQGELNKLNVEASKLAAEEIVHLDILYNRSQDLNSSYEDRVIAVNNLKSEYPDYFEDLTTEEILIGKGADAYERLALSIEKAARAKAYEEQITENVLDIIKLEGKLEKQRKKTAKAKKDENKISRAYDTGAVEFSQKKEASIQEEIDLLKSKNIEIAKGIELSDPEAKKSSKKEDDPVLKALQDQRDLISLQQDGQKKELELQQNQLAIELHEAKGNQEKIIALNDWSQREIASIKEKYRQQEEDYEDKAEAEENQALSDRVKAEVKLTKAQLKELQTRYKNEVAHLQNEADLADLRIDMSNASEEEKTKLKLENELEYYRKLMALSKTMQGQMSEDEVAFVTTKIAAIKKAIGEVGKGGKKGFWEMLGIDLEPAQMQAMEQAFNMTMDHLAELADAELAVAEAATEAAEARVEAAQSIVDAEIEARNNGYANSVDTANKELALAKQSQQQALEDESKAQKKALVIDSLSQASSLITATTTLLESPFTWGLIPVMWGTFFASKAKAFQATEPVTYGDGGSEFLDYGGSHASGNDIDIGRTADGRARRAERGEMLSVINRKSTAKYRQQLPGIIDSLNKGRFFEQYGNSYAAASPDINFAGGTTDLTKLEGDVSAMRKANERKTYVDSKGNRVEVYKNLKRIYRAS